MLGEKGTTVQESTLRVRCCSYRSNCHEYDATYFYKLPISFRI